MRVEDKKNVDDVPIIHEFLAMFPDDLLGVSPNKLVEFWVNLIPGATPIAKVPYCLAPSKIHELST